MEVVIEMKIRHNRYNSLKEMYDMINKEIKDSVRPIILFHDDADGLSSFLLVYRMVSDGRGIPVKSAPKVDDRFIKKANDYQGDKVFVVDVPILTQKFVDSVNKRIIWIDHHPIIDIKGIRYYNPRFFKKSYPVTHTIFKSIEEGRKDDIWIAMTGCIGDWFIPDFSKEFSKKYPDLYDINTKNPGDVLYKTGIGKLSRIFNFILKGKTSDIMKCVKTLTRIESPYEILNKETPRGKFIYKYFEKIYKNYKILLNNALKNTEGDFISFVYENKKFSFTSDLGTELSYRFPNKFIVIGRRKSGYIKCSLRSKDVNLQTFVEKAIEGLDGYGGGHEHACGANVNENDFNVFIKRLKDLWNKRNK